MTFRDGELAAPAGVEVEDRGGDYRVRCGGRAVLLPKDGSAATARFVLGILVRAD